MTKFFCAVALAVGVSAAALAKTGDSEGNAVSVKLTGTAVVRRVTLVPAYDSDDQSTDDSTGVYYFKATLNRGYSYTTWTTGVEELSPDETNKVAITLSAYAQEKEDSDADGPSADFTEVEESGGDTRLVLYADDWYIDDEDKSDSDPKSWTYFFVLEGNVGDTVTVNFQQGVVIPAGREDNPLTIVPTTSGAKLTRNLQMNDEFYLRARLMAGRLYWFATSGGSTDNVVFDISVSSDEDSEDSDDVNYSLFTDPAFDDDDGNSGVFVIPDETGYFSIVVGGSDSESEDESVVGTQFGFSHRLFAERAISAHESKSLDATGGVAECTPGYMHSPAAVAAGYWDAIADENLFSFSAVAGARYVLSTSGAATNLVMRVYDSKGVVLCENTGDGLSMNVRCAFEAKASGTFYVGVAQAIDDEFNDSPANLPVTLSLARLSADDGTPDEWDANDDVAAGATGLSPVPAASNVLPSDADPKGHGMHTLDIADWADVFVLAARKGIVYRLSTTLEDPFYEGNTLAADVFTLNGTTERAVDTDGDINPGSAVPLTFEATVNGAIYVRIRVAEGNGLDYPRYAVHATASASDGSEANLGVLTVETRGTSAGAWSLDSETVKYPGGSSVLVSGKHTVKFAAVSGFSTPAAQSVTVAAGDEPVLVQAYYSDTFDPKDDTARTAVAWTLKTTATKMSRTLWPSDPEDNFALTGKDGQYVDIAFESNDASAAFSITNAEKGVVADGVTSVSKLALPASRAKYYLVVAPGKGYADGGAYSLSGTLATVGSIKLAKTALAVNENAASFALSVSRTGGKDGTLRVKYGTVAGTAQPGVDYVAQSGILEWGPNDASAKTVTIGLIPDLVPQYEGNKQFAVRFEAVEDIGEGEYPASFSGLNECTVTLKEVSRAGTTVESSYAAIAPKLAVVATEKVSLATGTFTGLLTAEDGKLTNGLPRLASVTFTASTANPAALSAKVAIAGKTYTFSAKGWDESDGLQCRKEFTLVTRVANVPYTNTLAVVVADGATSDEKSWLGSGGSVELVMNVPDANGKGVQHDVRYTGTLARNNAKIQDYLVAVTNFTGYYTVALRPQGVTVADGIPAGNGYITLTVDNKGVAKVAGMLADGSTKPSLSVAACAILPDGGSSNGYAMEIPVFLAKSPVCFGGMLRLYADGTGTVVADASSELSWSNDSPAASYANDAGFSVALTPVGGWYDKIACMQAYYIDYALEVGTVEVGEFPKALLTSGFAYSTVVEPDGTPVSVAVDAFATEKKVAVKAGMLVDFAKSTNICNVQVKLARATGLVSGTYSLWSESADGTKQKEITGNKHNGVLVLSRDAACGDDSTAAFGFTARAVKLSSYDAATKRTISRNWTFSAPFDVIAVERPPVDPWDADWGEKPGEP